MGRNGQAAEPLGVAQSRMLSSLKGRAGTSGEGLLDQLSGSWSALVPSLVLHQSLTDFGEMWDSKWLGIIKHWRQCFIGEETVFLSRKWSSSLSGKQVLGSRHRLWISDIQGQQHVSFLFLFPLFNFILIIKNTADHTEWLLAERQSVPEGPVVGHQVYDAHKTRARSEGAQPPPATGLLLPQGPPIHSLLWIFVLFWIFYSVLFPDTCASVHVCTH